MKKLVVLIIPILLLTACTSNEEDKIAYLEYKNELEKQETFSPDTNTAVPASVLRS